MERKARSYWEALAAGGLTVAPPLAPNAEDVRWLESRAGAARAWGDRLHALVLGITPALLSMKWPEPALVAVVDWSGAMLRHRWPRERPRAPVGAVAGDWRELPFGDRSLDFACGDGCYTALGDSGDVPRVNAEIARVLRPGGWLCLRCFVLAERPVPVGEVCAALRAGRLRNPSLFRWLFIMALHSDAPGGVHVGKAWAAWREHFPDAEALRSAHGWDDEAFAGFERWKDQSMRYCFHTLAHLRVLAAPYFDLVEVEIPGYDYGERFPRLALRRR